jgi:hypothetical protein
MTYYHFEGSLVRPTMEEPKPRYAGGEIPSMIKHAWRDHLRSLPKIKVEGKLKEGWVEPNTDFKWKAAGCKEKRCLLWLGSSSKYNMPVY